MRIWSGHAANSAIQLKRSTLTVTTVPTKLAREQIAALCGKAKASFLFAVQDIRHRGYAAAGVRLAGETLSGICRLDLYGAWRLLTVFEAPDRCVLLLVAEHTRSANPYRLVYAALGGWRHFLASLAAYAEGGTGHPFGAERDSGR